MQSREVHCANKDLVVFPEDACDAAKKPELTKECPKSAMCEAMWRTSERSELLYQEKNLGISSEYSIPATTKVPQTDSYEWMIGDYGECSQSCGG
ncbi:hypothetical protein AVEN_269511-1, partial [Araneus ventricosus]